MGRNSSKDGKKPEQNQMKNQGVSPPDIQGGSCRSFSLKKQAGGSLSPLVNSLYPSWGSHHFKSRSSFRRLRLDPRLGP